MSDIPVRDTPPPTVETAAKIAISHKERTIKLKPDCKSVESSEKDCWVAITDNVVSVIDRAGRKTEVNRLDERLGLGRGASWCWDGDGKVFAVCGKVAYRIPVPQGEVEELPPLMSPRFDSGVCFLCNTIYLFGGTAVLDSESPLKSYISFTGSSQWCSADAQMNYARHAFHPVVNGPKAYLVGGAASSVIDVFDAETRGFERKEVGYSIEMGAKAVWISSKLIIIQRHMLSVEDRHGGRIEGSRRLDMILISYPLAVGETVYVLNEKQQVENFDSTRLF